MSIDWSVCGNETAFLYHVPASSGSFPFRFLPKFVTPVTDALNYNFLPRPHPCCPINVMAFAVLCNSSCPITVGKQGWASNWREAFKSFDLVLARFQRWRHKTSRPPSPAMTRVESNCLQITPFAKSYFHWDIFTPRWMDIKCQKAGLPVCQEGCPHLFQSWASAHQPLSISISRLEICLESRQVLLGDYWPLIYEYWGTFQ